MTKLDAGVSSRTMVSRASQRWREGLPIRLLSLAHSKAMDAERAQLLSQQWEQAHEMFRNNKELLVQAWGFLIGADVILVGYGITQRSVGVMLCAALIPLLMVATLYVNYKDVLPYIYLALEIERQLGIEGMGAMHHFVQLGMARSWRRLEPILEELSESERIAALHRAMAARFTLTRPLAGYLYGIALTQLLFSVVAKLGLGYSF